MMSIGRGVRRAIFSTRLITRHSLSLASITTAGISVWPNIWKASSRPSPQTRSYRGPLAPSRRLTVIGRFRPMASMLFTISRCWRLLRARGFRTVIREMGIISIRFGRTAGIRRPPLREWVLRCHREGRGHRSDRRRAPGHFPRPAEASPRACRCAGRGNSRAARD